ncbi:hypothetical protein N7532_011281 [Penicillium argentinense]|uniref:PRISE-like Rossmann-fold domain-containing protein n=1 Tax=Penicillium argentinense TaxID=1131581 RepID=A0A9W9EI48_9EURO|nr:uncharacterized protein N7532_011281 [Penicillium argentinense]KAJ5082238.1 hypothetical protein N7532_011281 [Penicillium argentinense]
MTQLIQSKSIYHGLPVFPEDVEGLTAIVTGSNGISGTHQLKVLAESPRRWKKIYALSRRPPYGTWPDHVEHVSVDLLQSPEEIARQLKERGVHADHVFFFAYIQPAPKEGGGIWSDAEELVRVNTQLLSNFLGGLELNKTIPKRVLLQLGAKYYGIHLGPALSPQEESDPRVLTELNFYYPQEDRLQEFAQKHSIGWNSTRPSHILGAVPDAAMNLCYPLTIYATVQKRLGQALEFPGDIAAWENPVSLSSAQANAYLSEWIVLTDAAKDESFNAADDCAFSWCKFWPRFAERFQIPWKGPDDSDRAAYRVITGHSKPPRGYGPPGELRFRFTLVDWAKRPEVQKAWKDIAEAHGLREKVLRDEDRVFGFADQALTLSYPLQLRTNIGMISMTKAKKMGYFGFVDSTDSFLQVVEDFVGLQMVPPVTP